ncbi:MAG: thioredoxin family protein [Tissierellia bacterium]|nr:thioredoxin family protein [Tissierellia bacterium]
MKIVNSNEVLDKLINEEEMLLVYFGNETCSICVDMKPKVLEILKKYPKIKAVEVKVDDSLKIARKHNIFTIPGILLFIDSKETIREARYISLEDIDDRISRYYNMFYN